jgi:exopolysaccharide biosynthesis polyprenyl glycosylphosphotransferase
MTALGTFFRRNYQPLLLSIQVFVDLAVLQLACWSAFWVGGRIGSVRLVDDIALYTQVFALICAVCLVCFNSLKLYSPVKSLLNFEEFKGILKGTIVSFFVFFTLVLLLQHSDKDIMDASGWERSLLEVFHDVFRWVDLPFKTESPSRITMVLAFVFILVFTMFSRFASFKYIQRLHRLGIGNRNALIYGAGECGMLLQRKLALVPTLGLNLAGFIDDDEEKRGEVFGKHEVLGGLGDLSEVVSVHKISEVFVALPSAAEERIVEITEQLRALGVHHHVVPRFYHLVRHRVRFTSLDSIPLFTRYEKSDTFFYSIAKRVFDILFSLLVLILASPVFLISALLIKRESKGPALFMQERVGLNGKPFLMLKFRTMHHKGSQDAPTPESPYDSRVTRIGRYLRRYSLDEIPQFLNVLLGDMSIVGPRPEMPFIVENYGPMERERLSVKPGITGLWQISYFRRGAIHENLEYDLFYIENKSMLLDLVIISLTGFAIMKGTGAY